MNIVRKDIDAVNATLTISIEKADYQEKVENKLKEYRRKANVPGFRPGMVPVGLVKKMYGKAILVEEINKIVSDSLFSHIEENNIQILGEPLPSNQEQKMIDFDTQEEFEFIFDLGLAPVIDLTLDKKTKIKQYAIEMTDEMVNNQVSSFTGRFGSYIQVEEVEEKDVIKGELVELESAKKEKEGGITVEAAVLTPLYLKDKKSKEAFIGKKIGDVVKINPKKAMEKDTEIASFLKIEKEAAAEIDADFNFTVTGITRYQEGEINQDLFDKVYGPDVVKSEEEFKAKIKESIQTNLNSDSDYKLSIDAKDALVRQLDGVAFPEEFLKRWVLESNENMTAEALEKDFPAMIDDLKWHLLKDKLAKDNDLKVEKEDIDAFGRKVALAQFAQYGMPNVPDDILDGYVKDMFKDERAIKNVVDNVVNEKVIAIIKEQVKLDTTKISIDDFNKMLEA